MYCRLCGLMMKKLLYLIVLLLASTLSNAKVSAASELSPFERQGWDKNFRLGDSFACFSDKIAGLGFAVPPNQEQGNNMGELQSYTDVSFGFSITEANKIKFSQSYPFSFLGNYEAHAGLNKIREAEFTLSWTEGKIRKATPNSYFLRVIMWGIASTSIMHATCEKL